MDASGIAPAAVGIELTGIAKAFDGRRVLDGFDLSIAPGEFVALVGRSGCGKSTVLRIAASLEVADAGSVRLVGAAASRAEAVRIMFQEPRLLPWKRVIENVRLGVAGGRASVEAEAEAALVRVGLADRGDDRPAVLSGGQRQRVALARALVHRPGLLLLDEPLGALDALTRIEMQRLVEDVWRQRGFAVLLVTHDIEEAVALADRVVLVEDGRVALDLAVPLARPRRRGDAAFAAIEGRLLDRILSTSASSGATARAA